MKRRKSRRTKRTRRLSRRLGAMLFWMNIMVLFFVAWTVNCETKAHVTPSWPVTELGPLLSKPELEQGDYQTLFRQTGLASITIDKLRAQGREAEIYEAQRLYFQEVTVKCEPNTVISREEYLVDQEGKPVRGMRIVDVEDGDILITYCSHTFGWRNGHAALVIDAENRLTLEAQVLGEPSKILSLDHWEEYPSFLVLRLTDASSQVRSGAARYAKENLVGIPYRLTAGIREAAGSWPERNIVKRKVPDMEYYESYHAGSQETANALEPKHMNADSQETANALEPKLINVDSQETAKSLEPKHMNADSQETAKSLEPKLINVDSQETANGLEPKHMDAVSQENVDAEESKNSDISNPEALYFGEQEPQEIVDLAASEETASSLTGTQCAHLVWYAYARFGYDLDSDGGFLVTPYDLENSPLLEIVQAYGVQRDY